MFFIPLSFNPRLLLKPSLIYLKQSLKWTRTLLVYYFESLDGRGKQEHARKLRAILDGLGEKGRSSYPSLWLLTDIEISQCE